MVSKLKALVTGGSGFLGKHIVEQLLDSGKYEVVVFDIRPLEDARVTSIVGDLRKRDEVKKACEGVDVVFHVATAAPTGENTLNKELMVGVNVEGTRNVVSACQANGVERLVYTSTASAVFDGTPLHMVTEKHAYAAKPMDFYTRTKIEGEQIILQANGSGGVATCALRPSGIFGEGDLLFVPTVIKNAERGKMKYIIGNGENLMDFTYAGNVAQAHLEAAEALSLTSKVAGQAYFITNNEPRPFWGMMGDVCEGLGYKRPSIKLPFLLIFILAAFFEYIIMPLLKPFMTLKTDFTVNRILLASTNRTFDSSKAKQDFGYSPKVPMDEALKKTLMTYGHLKKQ